MITVHFVKYKLNNVHCELLIMDTTGRNVHCWGDLFRSITNVIVRVVSYKTCLLRRLQAQTLSNEAPPIDKIQIYDYKKMFDSMELEEAISDIFDSGVRDDSLAPLYDANKNIKVRVKTQSGLGVEQHFKKVVLQGDTWGPIMASNQVDTLGKQLLEEEPSFLYK